MNMKKEIQARLIQAIENRIDEGKNLGTELITALEINKDAVYRRIRLQSDLTLADLKKIRDYFNISIDAIIGEGENGVVYENMHYSNGKFNTAQYLKVIHDNLAYLNQLEDVKLTITINNTHFLSLFNFPDLLRFKLFFWMRNYYGLQELKQLKFEDFVFEKQDLKTISKIADLYNNIPSVELYDAEMFRGLAREIYFYHKSNEILESNTTSDLYQSLQLLCNHLEKQAEKAYKFQIGKKVVKTKHNQLEVYYNEILNAMAVFHYSNKKSEGLFITQNFLNPSLTTNKIQTLETKKVLDNMIANSVKISLTGKNARKRFFSEINQFISLYLQKIALEDEFKK